MVYYLALGLGLFAVERAIPARPLPRTPAWKRRAAAASLAQLVVTLVVAHLARGDRAFVSLDGLSPLQAGGLAYLGSTFLWYWWHRARHASRPLWLVFHQLHHSAERIELATSFYKHPAEQLANALLAALVAGPLFGLEPSALMVYGLLAFGAELFYHWNVRTPAWLGYFVQRPEMHRVHHERGRHTHNYGDLPIWDLLFGTFENPAREVECGFAPGREERVLAMLAFRDVEAPRRRARTLGLRLVTALGLASIVGTALVPIAPDLGAAVAGIGKLSLMAPFPKVFCARDGTEPWAYSHTLTLIDATGAHTVALERGSPIFDAPYQHRNALGAAAAYGPWMPDATVLQVLTWATCEGGVIDGPPPLRVRLDSEPLPGIPGAARHLEIEC